MKQEWQISLAWDLANRWQKLGLVWINRKKTSQIINAYFYLPFFLLIILWLHSIRGPLPWRQQITTSPLLPKLSIPSDYSVSDIGFTHHIALKNNSMHQDVLRGFHCWKRRPGWITEKLRKNPLGTTEVYDTLDKCIRGSPQATGRRALYYSHLSLYNITFTQNIRKKNRNNSKTILLHVYRIVTN